MKSYLLLLKINLKTLLSNMLGGGMRKENGKLDLSKIVLYIIAGFGVLVLIGSVIFMECVLYDVLAAIGQQKLLMGLAVLLSMVMTLVFGVFHTLAAMFFNRDTVSIAHLPIPSRTMMAAKWTEIYVPESLISVGILLPLCILYGLDIGAGFLYYALSLLLVLAVPVYPLAISMLLASVLGRFTALMKHREVWIVLGTIIMLVVVLGAETLLIPSIPDDADAMFFLRLIMDQEALLNMLIGAFPPVLWAVDGLTGQWLQVLLFIAVGAVAVTVLIALMGKGYLAVCLRHTEHGTSGKRRSRRKTREDFKLRSPLMAVFHREMSEMFRVPVYLLNGVMGAMMMPLMMVVMYIMLSANEETAMFMEALQKLVSELGDIHLTLICAALLSLMCWITPVISTSVSREGKRLEMTRMIPVAPGTILNAKLLMHLVFNAVSSIFVAGCIVAVLGWAYLPHLLAALLMANLLSYATGVANLVIDVLRPVLEWKNENEVMKQNMNSLLGALLSTILMALVIAPPVLMAIRGVDAMLMLLAVVVLLILECLLAVWLMKKVAIPRYAALEP